MNSLLRYSFLFLFGLHITCSYSQFKGGAYDGFATNKIDCPAPVNIFTGGSYDGLSTITIACPPPTNVFTGGSFDGFAVNGIACATPSNVYTGGPFDGFSSNGIACAAPSNVFTGGSFDGFASNAIACPAPSNIFTGGSYEGFSSNSIACPAAAAIFTGGSFDGFSMSSIACPVAAAIFTGGSFDGFSLGSIACPVTAAIFSGGSYDGFALNSIACIASSNVFTGGSFDGFSLNRIACAIASNVFTGGSYDGFANGTFGPCNPLPIELLYFNAACYSGKVTLTWATASQINNDYFTVGRTPDGINYQDIGTVKGAGNSTQTLLYSYIDPEPLNGIFYYRLKQTDYNGQYEYFNIITATCIESAGEINIYPNPNNGRFVIQGAELNAQLIVLDPLGEKVLEQKISSVKTEINLENLPNGIYFVQIISGKGKTTKKISINK